MIIRIEYEGWQSELFHSDYDRVVKRGILDIYELSDEPDEWVVLDPYIFWSSRIQKAVVVPRWFITDLSSIPKPARILISVNERHRIPSLPHDVLYTLKGVLSEDDTITKEEADLVFLDFLKLFNVPTWKAQSMYWAVRLGGQPSWDGQGSVFAPIEHREWYVDQHLSYNFNLTEGGWQATVVS